jgi:hypothetical protein
MPARRRFRKPMNINGNALVDVQPAAGTAAVSAGDGGAIVATRRWSQPWAGKPTPAV